MMRKASHTPRRGGFALIVAISLMVFVLLLTLSLSSFTMVETSTSVQQRAIARAQLNAKFGLMKAMAQLQEMAGPDQRVTAQASILDNNPDTTDIDGIATAKYWTGVWNSEYPTDADGNPVSVHQIAGDAYNDLANRRTDSDANNSRFLGWLVSGEIDLTDARNYTPNDDDDALLLSNTDADENVYARKVAISDTDDTSLGLYAYWIDDEGVKAKFNMRDIHKEDGLNNDERRYSVMAAQRSGVENMTKLAQAGFPVNEGILNNMASSASLSSYYSARGAGDAALTALAEDTAHDLTAYSYGLLTDPKHGGLKKDLTWYFEQTSGDDIPASLVDVSYYANPDFVGFENGEPRLADFPDPKSIYCEPGPTWKKLRSWYQFKDEYGVNSAIEPRTTTETQHGIGPIAVRGLLSFYPEINPIGGGVDVDFNVHIGMQVLLWNPYNVRLAPHDYEIEFMMQGATCLLYPQFFYEKTQTKRDEDAPQKVDGQDRYYYANSFAIQHGVESRKGLGASAPKLKGVLQHENMSTFQDEGGSPNTGVIFKVLDETGFEPGEVKIFTISDSSGPYEYEEDGDHNVLVEGLHDGTVYLPYGLLPVANPANGIPTGVSDGIKVDKKDVNDVVTSTTVYYPKFHWRTFRSWGTNSEDPNKGYNNLPSADSDSSLDIMSSSPYGEIRGFGLREPLADDATRQLKTNGVVSGLDVYYSRQFRENNNRVDLNDSESGFIKRDSTEIFASHDEKVGRGTPTVDWFGGPNFEVPYEFSVSMYEFKTGSPNGGGAASPFIHWNPAAIESRRDGLNYKDTSQSGYNAIGWASGPKFPNYGGRTVFDTDTTSGRPFFGRGFASSEGLHNLPLLDVPQENQPILSLGFFQHANLNRQDINPTYQIGNSYPEIRLIDLTDVYRDGDTPGDTMYAMGEAYTGDGYPSIIDTTYLLNDALWDRFFLSTYVTPAEINDPDFTPPNARLVRIDPQEQVPASAINDFFDMAAAYLTINGAFNVNSTSVEAWKAALGSLSDIDVNLSTGGTIGTAHDRVVTHYTAPQGNSATNDENDWWSGYRELTSEQLTALAQEMVKQVKLRGPFLSLGEFVNRRLATDETGMRGAMQAAIDALDYNGNTLATGNTAINAPATAIFNTKMTGDSSLPSELFIEEAARTHHYGGVPAWVKQGDIIQALGPSLAVRSDTFRIRSYGETVDPFTGEKTASAVCEAIVQRLPTPVTPGNNDASTTAYYEPADALGRKFVIVSFHWLTNEEI